ncbi:MAG: CopG family transcriptional regulator [Candidatus Omnitrophota bacterium]
MRKKTINQDKPIGKLTRIADFLPPPEELVMPQETVKVTIALSKSSIEFFKQKAKQHHIKYQRMIRQLVDRYAMLYS